jgi:hypothetical protein
MKHPSEFSQELLALVSRDYSEALELSPQAELRIIKTIKNPYSIVYLLEPTRKTIGPRVYVKIPFSDFQGKEILTNRLVAEFEILQTINNDLEHDANIGVAKPIGIYKIYPALATLDAGKVTLRKQYNSGARLIASSASKKKLNNTAEIAGTWLRKFQEITKKTISPFQTEELAIYCDVRIQKLKIEHNEYITHDALDRVLTGIHNLATNTSEINYVAGRHNDFASHNIVLDENKLNVIDFSMFDYGPTSYDPCNFWLDLEALKLDSTYSTSQLNKMQEIFLASYGSISPDSAFFNLARCRYTLNRIVTYKRYANGWSPSAFYRRRVIKSCSDWLANFAEKHSN